MPDNTITVGQQHYYWSTKSYAWIGKVECVITNVIDPKQQLFLSVSNTQQELFRVNALIKWVAYAINQGWYNESRSYFIQLINGNVKINLQNQSLEVEQLIVQQLASKYKKKVSLLSKSEMTHQLHLLNSNLPHDLPTLLQQLYVALGNGNFGPDYGFLSIYEEVSNQKITIFEAYQELHQQKITDWDWTLPAHFVPFLYWGSNIYSVLDLSSPSGAVWVLDENLKTSDNHWRHCFWQHCPSLFEWLQKWSAGDETGRQLWLEMYQLKGLL